MKSALFPFALLALGQAAFAQQPPGAGSQLLQIPPSPAAPRAAPEIRIEQRSAPAPAPAHALKILVQALRVSGSTVFSEADLIALTGFRPGSEVTLAELQGMAGSITDHYRRSGYFVAQAYLPAQDIKHNVVTIAVTEGRYGQVTVRNQSSLSDRVPRRMLGELNSGDVIAGQPLESRLLLLSDVPGITVRSTLVPGTASGTSDLVVDVTPGQRVTGSVVADNAGNRYTGAGRVGAEINLNNPFGLGDAASLRLLTSGSGFKYARAAYQMPVGSRSQLGVAYSMLDYSLGKQFAPLRAHGTAQVASVFGRYALVRSRDRKVYLQLTYDAKDFKDKFDLLSSVIDSQSQVLTASIHGDHRDELGAGGLSSFTVAWGTGRLDMKTPPWLSNPAAPRTHFNKLVFNAMRLQSLGGPFSLYGAINGQMASGNLDVSEEMELGGMHAVRAYPEGEAYADQGVVLTIEGRMDLPKFSSLPGHVQLIAFADAGRVTIDKDPWAAGLNRRRLSGAGVGVNWSDPGNFMVRAFYAHKLGNEAATSSPDRSGRFWVQLAKYF